MPCAGDPLNLIRVMPAKGQGLAAKAPVSSKAYPDCARQKGIAMNKPISASELTVPKVTTGPLTSSRKVYARPEMAPDLRVPVREIVLSEASGEPPLPVYDTTGPYTDSDVAVDVEQGLKRPRTEWVKER